MDEPKVPTIPPVDPNREELPIAVPAEQFLPPKKKLGVKQKILIISVLCILVGIGLFIYFK